MAGLFTLAREVDDAARPAGFIDVRELIATLTDAELMATADEIEATEVEQAHVVEFDEDDACVTVGTKLPTTLEQVDEVENP